MIVWAYERGRNDRRDRRNINPFPFGTELSRNWKRGWDHQEYVLNNRS